MKRTATWIAPLSLALAACTSAGTGMGYLHNDTGLPVRFEWHGKGTASGTLTAEFEDGRVFTGTYFRITQESRVDHPAPLWACWSPTWSAWPNWHQESAPEFARHYTGRVLATLDARDGSTMSCRFQLVRPSSGLQGGGQGTCELWDGGVLKVDFSTP